MSESPDYVMTDYENAFKRLRMSELLDSFRENTNTAVEYEILVGLYLLDKYINDISRIENLTQDDDSGTGDIKIIYKDGTQERISIKNYKGKKICSWNPSGKKHFKVKTAECIELSNKCYNKSIKWRIDNEYLILDEEGLIIYFEERVQGDQASKKMCEKLASIGSDNFNKMDKSSQFEIFRQILDLKSDNRPDKYSLQFDSIFGKDYYLKNIKLREDFDIRGELECIAEGIYIKLSHKNPGGEFNEIASIQCKYNDGIIENRKKGCKPKEGRPFGSWNCKLDIDKVFVYETIKHDLEKWGTEPDNILIKNPDIIEKNTKITDEVKNKIKRYIK